MNFMRLFQKLYPSARTSRATRRPRIPSRLPVVAATTIITLAATAAFAGSATNTWNMSTNADYYIAPTNQPLIMIDSTQGVARLILLSDEIHRSTFGEYVTNGSAHVSTKLGPDVALSLKQLGGVYQNSGTFISRVLDSGSPANTWQKMYARATYGSIINSPAEIQTGGSGPVALYHLNSDWNDTLGLRNLSPMAGASLVTPGQFGAKCGFVDGGVSGYATSASGFPEMSKITVSMWIKASRSQSQIVQYVFGLGNLTFALHISGFYSDANSAPGSITVVVSSNPSSTTGGQFTDSKDVGVWRHIVAVYDSTAAQKTRIYKDGVELPMMSQKATGTVPTTGSMIVGMRYDKIIGFQGAIDELAVYDRALSQEEVLDLYSRGLSFFFQLRGGNTTAETTNTSNQFTGPDGTTNSYYFGENRILQTAGSFDVTNQYAQYKAYLIKDTSGNTPWFDAVTLFGDLGMDVDYSFLDFRRGDMSQSTTNYPGLSDTPYLSLAKKENGGYYTNGTYVSRAMDAGSSVNWRKFEWQAPGELTNDIQGLIALYHLKSWGDAQGVVGGDNTPASVTMADSSGSMPKLGMDCGRFDGVSSHVTGFPGLSTNIMTVEFWINDDNPQDGIMTLASYSNGPAYLAISNGIVITRGFANITPQVYVNGLTGSRKLMAGWNHVAITFDKVLAGAALDVGVANGDYMQGLMDEMAIYTRQLSGIELKAHYLLGRQSVGGVAKFAFRTADSIAALTGGVWSTESTTPFDPNSLGQYFQYRLTMEGDGSASPAVKNITVGYLNPGWQYMYDHDREAIYQGAFVGGTTKWSGDEVMLVDQSQWGPLNLSSLEAGLVGEWRLDESSWGTVSGTPGGNGTALGGAQPIVDARVGLRSAQFSVTNQYLTLGSPSVGSGDFTVGAWVKSTASNRCAIVSTFAGGAHYTLEFNGDGTTNVPGKAALVIDTAPTDKKVVASVLTDINDGRWHHVAGMRRGDTLHLYIDGDRVASANIGSAYGSVGSGTIYVGKYGTSNLFLRGQVDEVVVFQRALSDAEVGELSGTAYRVRDRGIYTSEIIDAGREVIWQTLSWNADAPYNKPLSTVYDTNIVALWHMDSNTLDSAGTFDGTLAGGAGFNSAGRFDSCLSLNGTVQWMGNITDAEELRPPNLTVEAWVYPTAVDSRIVFDKSSGGQGYQLGTDSSGRPVFKVGSVLCIDPALSLRTGAWTHLVATYSGSELALYVNGEIRARAAGSGSMGTPDARIGADGAGSGCFAGFIDEVAVHDRVLQPVEILDHYRAGAVTLKFQARSGSNATLIASAPFVGPAGTTNSYFTVATGEGLQAVIPKGQCFQYKAYLGTENHRFTPRLHGVTVESSGYSTENPAVETASGVFFPGKITTFVHTMATNNDASVRYQISGDNGATWYYWPLFTNAWVNADLYGGGWENASPVGTVNQYVGNFYRQLYEKTGVNLLWRAFLHSTGSDQVAIDAVSIGYSRGRVLVTFPSGTETDTRSLVVGTPYDITWSWLGTVSNNITVELLDGTNVVSVLGTGLPNNGVFRTVISEQRGTNYYIRVKDGNDPNNIWDLSDGPFWLREQLHMTSPDGGEKWYIGRTNLVRWDSPKWGAQNLVGPIDIWFSGDAGTNWFVVATPTNASGTNVYYWNTPLTNWQFVSENARMGVATPGAFDPASAFYGDISDGTYTNAGIVVTFPATGNAVNMGEATTLEWYAAGAGSHGVTVDFFDGVAWTNISTNATCVPGYNTLGCVLEAKDPSEAARIRITANDDPVNVTGISGIFILADINIITPVGGSEAVRSQWQIGTTNYVRWTAAGAGSSVDITYSPDGGSSWYTIASGWANTNSSVGNVVTNVSPPWVVAGPPSSNSMIRVKSVSQSSLFATTPPYFDVSGVQVTYPNGGEYWEFGRTNLATWLHQAAGANVGIDCAYISSPTTNDYENIVASASIFNGRWVIPAANVRRPTTVGKLRIRAISPPSGIPMEDYSDATFTIRGLSVTQPTNSAAYTLGTSRTNGLEWYSARAGANLATVYYSTNGVTYSDLITFSGIGFTGNQDADPSINQKTWDISRRLMPSLTARIKVVVGTTEAVSSQFTLRGIRMIRPALGSVYNIGAVTNVAWRHAGLSANPFVSNSISVSGEGGPYVQGGLPNNASVLNPLTPWTVDAELDPTTNAVIKMVVTAPAQDTDVTTYSDPFTLRGIKFLSPYTGTNWVLRGQVMVSFRVAGMGSGAFADIYYSADGGATFDTVNPVASGVSVNDGIVSVPWTIESTPALTRTPSTNACLLAVCGSYTSRSKTFQVSGLKVTAPTAADVLAVSDGTNTVAWTGVGVSGTYNVSFTRWPETTPVDFSTPVWTEVIATGVSGWSCDWAMTANAVGSNVTVTVSDGTFTATSAVFQVVSSPAIKIINPTAGDFWKVTETNEIRWVRAGNVSNAFSVAWSPYPYEVTNVLAIGAFPLSGGVFSYAWENIPNSIGKVRIIVTNQVTEGVRDQFEDFEIAVKFAIDPLIGDLFALQTRDVNWTTYGSIFSGVDFYYSLDPFRRTNYWRKINTTPFMAVANEQPSIYSWQLPNVKTNTVWLRIQDHAYSNRLFDASKPGPYNDLGMLNVRYYTVYWEVMDAITSNDLDNLAVIDSSGWSQSGLTCAGANTISHEYPWGTWNTAWMREFFFDNVVMYWESENYALGSPAVWTQQVYMVRSTVEPDYRAMANFSYETSNKVFTIHAWLERGGEILDTPSRCRITVYDETGNEVRVLDSAGSPPDGSLLDYGVFWMAWDASALSPSSVYFARVEIEFSGVWYSSGLTFTLRVPVGEEISGMIGGISNQVAGVSNQVIGVYTSLVAHEVEQAAFRGRTDSNLATIASSLGVLTNLSDMATSVSNLVAAMQEVAKMTNISTMAESLSNIWDAVTNIGGVEDQLLPKITARSTTIKTGSTNMFVYRTRMGLGSGPVITVQNAAGATNQQGSMAEIPNTGLYKAEVVFDQGWGLGEFPVSCRDSAAESAPGDQITIQVVGEGYWTDAQSLASMTGRLAYLETTVSNVLVVVGAADFGANFSNVIASVSNLETIVNSTSVSNAAAMVVLRSDVSNVLASVTNLQDLVGGMGASNVASLVALGGNLSNVFAAVSNLQVVVSGSDSSNTAAMASLRSDVSDVLASVTNLQDLVGGMGVSNAASLVALGANLSNVFAAVSNLQDLGASNAASLVALETNVATALGVVNSLGSLTNLASLTSLTNLVSALADIDLTTIQSGVADLQTRVNQMDWALVQQTVAGLAAMQATVDSSFADIGAQITALAGVADSVDALSLQTGAAIAAGEKAAKEARSAKTQVTTLQGALTTLRAALGQGDRDTAMDILGGLRAQMADVQGAVSKQVSLQPVVDVMVPIAADINALAKRKNLDELVNIPAELRMQTQVTEQGLMQANNKMAEMSAAIEFLNKLVDRVANPPEVMTYWTTE
ncbi:MAG: LamG-like jellyroll fold domain-containing protein [bacterium]